MRCEFFDDEIDSLGLFDPGTQRRTENVSAALLLPAAEVLPGLAPAARPIWRSRSKSWPSSTLRKKTEKDRPDPPGDAERFRNSAEVNGLDRYLNLIYPDAAGGADYLPPDAVVFLCEGGALNSG